MMLTKKINYYYLHKKNNIRKLLNTSYKTLICGTSTQRNVIQMYEIIEINKQ